MVELTIDNKIYEAPEGVTILEVAKTVGLRIPYLCHNDGLPHYTSCMVCMVKDKKTNNFIPSCSALIYDGMDIDISSEEVKAIRSKSVEMLLAEHRAECEAPCKVVCPAGYNIPLMNRLLASNDLEGAIQLVLSEVKSSELMCGNCSGYCENACRRKKIDLPVSIRNMKLFISQQVLKDNQLETVQNTGKAPDNKSKSGKLPKRFASHIGRLEPSELQEWLKESVKDAKRFREISSIDQGVSEAGSCMHCDCRAAENCRLRDISEEFSVKDPRGKLVNSPIAKKVNHKTGLIFENAKCIKCGLCVRLSEESGEEPALGFIHRGFVSIISEPLTVEFDEILKSGTEAVIKICPTGALSKKV